MTALDTYQLYDILSQDLHVGPHFGGVYPRDRLPSGSTRRSFVVNTDTSDRPGEHWVCIHFGEDGVAEYFDSYGLPPWAYGDIVRFMRSRSKQYLLQYDPLPIGRDQSMWPLLYTYVLPETKKPWSIETGIGPRVVYTVPVGSDHAKERPIRIPMVPEEISIEKTSPIPLSNDKRACDERNTIVLGPAIMFRLVVLYVFDDHRIVRHLRCRRVSETTYLGHCIVLRAVWA